MDRENYVSYNATENVSLFLQEIFVLQSMRLLKDIPIIAHIFKPAPHIPVHIWPVLEKISQQ